MTFSYRGVALAAFQAGNDILQLADFQPTDSEGELQSVVDTIKYFQQQYQVDNDFASKVDQAVLRILALKTRLYPDFSIATVQGSQDGLSGLKQDSALDSENCKAGVTQISPNPKTPGATAVEPPTSADRIVVLTDSRNIVPCPSCAQEADLSPTEMAQTILRLYGPGASGLIAATRIQSYTFKDLYSYLQGVPSPDLETALKSATVILALVRSPDVVASRKHPHFRIYSHSGRISSAIRISTSLRWKRHTIWIRPRSANSMRITRCIRKTTAVWKSAPGCFSAISRRAELRR